MTREHSSAVEADLPLVVVLGAGFAGLAAVRRLAKQPVRIIVIDGHNHHLFQPLLYQVATAALNPSDIAYPIRSVFRHQRNVEHVLLASARGVDLEGKKLELDDGAEIRFDKLIIATGATHSYFGNEHWARFAPGLKTIEDALEIRRRVLTAFEEAERYPEEQQGWLTFAVVGAGPTGVELAGALIEIAVDALKPDFDKIDTSRARIVLLEGGERVLPAYPEDLSRSAEKQLASLGVDVRTATKVTDIDEHGVTFEDGSRLEARTVLWAAGVRASPIAQSMGCELDRVGRVVVAPDLSVPAHPDVFVVGDLATVRSNDEPVPGVAPAAMQMGRHAARQIARDLGGKPREAFRYRDKGSLATIGKARAVADFGRLRFGGPVAWLAWMAIHVFFLVSFRNRLFVMLSWAWSYVTFRRGARLITAPAPMEPRTDRPAGAPGVGG